MEVFFDNAQSILKILWDMRMITNTKDISLFQRYFLAEIVVRIFPLQNFQKGLLLKLQLNDFACIWTVWNIRTSPEAILSTNKDRNIKKHSTVKLMANQIKPHKIQSYICTHTKWLMLLLYKYKKVKSKVEVSVHWEFHWVLSTLTMCYTAFLHETWLSLN